MLTVTKSGFGARLRDLREGQGLTQKELGEQVGMSAQAVARLEAGVNEPTWPTVRKLADALGVKPNDFLPGGEEADEDE